MPYKSRTDRIEYERRCRADPVFKAKIDARLQRWRDRGGKKKEYERTKADPVKYLEFRMAQAQYRRNQRAAVLALYGDKCACCGETEPAFIAIDHVNGGGRAHRKTTIGLKFWNWLLSLGEPDPRFRLLCHNCNHATHFEGVCPHAAKRS